MNEETPGKCLRQIEQIWFRLMLFNATFNNISFYIVVVSLIVGETGAPGENHRPVVVTQIFHYGQPYHGGDRKTFEMTSTWLIMTSTWLIRTFGSVASLLAATLYQGNTDRNHNLWNIVS